MILLGDDLVTAGFEVVYEGFLVLLDERSDSIKYETVKRRMRISLGIQYLNSAVHIHFHVDDWRIFDTHTSPYIGFITSSEICAKKRKPV